MSCEHSGALVHGYLDGELDAMRAADFEKHLADCRECKAALAEAESLRAVLQGGRLYDRAPDSLRQKVRAGMESRPVKSVSRSPLSWRWPAAAAVILVAALSWMAARNQRPGGIFGGFSAGELIDAHIRSLQPGHLMDVQSTDQHTVKPWFDGKLDYVPPVPDFTGQGFPLMGGRLDVLRGRSVAVLVYGRRKHIINVFVWPTNERDLSPESSSVYQGYQWVHWRNHGLEFYAVSDVSGADLQELAQLFLQ